MNVGYFKVVNEDGYGWWVRPDRVGAFGESRVHPKRPAGRPPQGAKPPQPVPVVTLIMDSGLRIHAREQTLETVTKMIADSLGVTPTMVKMANFHESDRRPDLRDPDDLIPEEDAED